MMNNDIICMIRSDGKIDVFLAIEDRMPANPFKELRAFFPQRQYKDAFYLKDRNEKMCELINSKWDSYDRSLMGIWHHPHYPENYEEIKKQSDFLFEVPEWCRAELKDSYIITI